MNSGDIRIGIDLGGTKIEGIALDTGGRTLWRQRINTPQGNYAQTLKGIASLVSQIEMEVGVSACLGICTPGAISSVTGRMKNCNSTCLNDHSLLQDLQQLMGRKFQIANDADCFALSEATDGAAQGANVVFGVILGTGVGGGIVVNQKLLSGPNAIAGEWGHNRIPDRLPRVHAQPGYQRQCYCGNQDCLETYLSGAGLRLSYTEFSAQERTVEDIVAAANRNEIEAVETMALYHRQLAACLAQPINILDPDVIVLGGGLSNIKSLYDEIPRLWAGFVFSDSVKTRLVHAKHGDSSGVRGAARL